MPLSLSRHLRPGFCHRLQNGPWRPSPACRPHRLSRGDLHRPFMTRPRQTRHPRGRPVVLRGMDPATTQTDQGAVRREADQALPRAWTSRSRLSAPILPHSANRSPQSRARHRYATGEASNPSKHLRPRLRRRGSLEPPCTEYRRPARSPSHDRARRVRIRVPLRSQCPSLPRGPCPPDPPPNGRR